MKTIEQQLEEYCGKCTITPQNCVVDECIYRKGEYNYLVDIEAERHVGLVEIQADKCAGCSMLSEDRTTCTASEELRVEWDCIPF